MNTCKWYVRKTSVYIQIVDEFDNLICFMGIKDYDYANAELIVKLQNENIAILHEGKEETPRREA